MFRLFGLISIVVVFATCTSEKQRIAERTMILTSHPWKLKKMGIMDVAASLTFTKDGKFVHSEMSKDPNSFFSCTWNMVYPHTVQILVKEAMIDKMEHEVEDHYDEIKITRLSDDELIGTYRRGNNSNVETFECVALK